MAQITPDSVDDYIQLSGLLFESVQRQGIFPDSKTFVDAIPKTAPEEIRVEYERQRHNSNFDLKSFVKEHFTLPDDGPSSEIRPAATMEEHIDQLWDYLSRQPDEGISEYSTLIPLPHPYIVPGGRFREIYYWDTYFTAEGLAASNRLETVENLTRNFTHLIELTGHVPNGNRYYYVSRSQPPFLVLLVDIIARQKEPRDIQPYVSALQQEYDFWMDGIEEINGSESYRRLVSLEGVRMNRYWDDRPLPREESWREDAELARELNPQNAHRIYRDLRAGAESGWDFSSRWLRDGRTLGTIHTTDILPVDLNALLYFLEKKLGEWTQGADARRYREAAEQRQQAFDRFFWNKAKGYYFDYDHAAGRKTDIWSLAGAYPLFLELASEEQAEAVARNIEKKFLREGGVVTTLTETGQQWDAPNGWAPLQWITVQGLLNYGHTELAHTIARRWLNLNEAVFERTGKMMEKYNVSDLSLKAGGGEYPLQDGFGWSNGVAMAFKKLLS